MFQIFGNLDICTLHVLARRKDTHDNVYEHYMCWQEEKVEVPRLRISASPVTSQVTESAPWMENMMESVGYNDWCPLDLLQKSTEG